MPTTVHNIRLILQTIIMPHMDIAYHIQGNTQEMPRYHDFNLLYWSMLVVHVQSINLFVYEQTRSP